jgi:hypothetical protein
MVRCCFRRLQLVLQLAVLMILFVSATSHGSKTPSVLARVQLAMFFDYLYFKPADNIMTVEPAILLMVGFLIEGLRSPQRH